MNAFRRFLPALRWLPAYDKKNLPGDLSAGATVAVMLIPQSMAYAMLAGLPPIVGLYACLAPLLLYALFGTSRQLAIGPTAMDSLLVAAGVSTLATQGSAESLRMAVLLAGMVGLLQFAMGVLRLGALVTFLSRPVVSGFNSAAAIVIAASQLGPLLGVRTTPSARLHELAFDLARVLGGMHLPTVVIAIASIALLLLLKRRSSRIPSALAVVVLGTLVTWALRLDVHGVAIVGAVPSGLPRPSLPEVDLDAVRALLPTAATLALVSFMESITVGKAFARRNKYEIDANQELCAVGLANLGNAFTGGFPVAGGLSRSAVNAQAGARTPLASAITAVLIAATLLFFTPLFHFLPKAVLAAIVVVAVSGLVDWREPIRLWKVKRSDALLLGVTFVTTLFVGIQQGVAAGIVASLALFVIRSTRPHNAILGRLPGTTDYRNVKNYPEAEEIPCITIWRFDSSFYFANADFFRDQIDRLLVRGEPPMRALVLDASGINDIDASAEALLHDIHERLEAAGIRLYFANVKVPVLRVMERGGLVDAVGRERFFLSVHAAVEAARAAAPLAERPAPCAGTPS